MARWPALVPVSNRIAVPNQEPDSLSLKYQQGCDSIIEISHRIISAYVFSI
ncbi:hypothetical protein C942_00339 [Photobacterium marinum]|uniref:Uncharacterized protein n=1 Tax=Photobacterium marinum TaxID=1056511 RepID=L8JCY6_9GAMM|nr:hypothetical protein C942_00339 [Photobacterium marinum]